MTQRPPPGRSLQRGGRSVGSARLLRERALASVDQCVCVTQCRGFDSLEPPGKIEPAPLRDRLDLIVAGTTSPSPSAFHIIDHLVAGAP